MLWKNRWTAGWFVRRVAHQPNRARKQDNQILLMTRAQLRPDAFLTKMS
jgi:hypothetical protein